MMCVRKRAGEHVICSSLRISLVCLLMMFGAVHTLHAQERTVEGKITDAQTGETLIGVNVKVKGTDQGTATDINGRFSLSVPSDAEKLVISYVGYRQKTVPIDGQSQFDIQLSEGMQMDEVVVTALGVEKAEKAIGYSVQKVQSEDITIGGETNVVSGLSGRAAGVNVQRNSSGAAGSAYITIRGQASLAGNSQPLFVVNGMPITNGLYSPGDGLNGSSTIDFGNAASMINPDDIETFNILKGPTAAALYGTRASNGVVLITTKTGEKTEGYGVSFNHTTTFEQVLRYPDYQNQYGGGGSGIRDWRDGTNYTGTSYDAFGESWGPPTNGQLVRQFGTANDGIDNDGDGVVDNEADGYLKPFTPASGNIEDFFETGVTVRNNIAVTNATDSSDFRFSYTNLQNSGVVPNTDLKRNTFATSVGNQITDKLHLRANINYVNGQSDNVPNAGYDESSSIMYGWLWYPRHLSMGANRDYWLPNQVDEAQRNHENLWTNNPYFLVNENTNSYQRDRIFGNIKVEYDLTDKLSLRYRAGGDFLNEDRQFRRAFSTRSLPFGQYREDGIYFEETNHEFMASYATQNYDNDWNFDVRAGGNLMQQRSRVGRTIAPQLALPGLFNLENGRATLQSQDIDQRKKINSLFGLATIDYKGWVYLDITGRNDWSSTLPADDNSYFYPSVSVSTVISEMLELPATSALSFAKVRASYAQVGGDTDPYALTNTFSYEDPWGGAPVVTESDVLRNPNLRPEQTETYEIGTDVRFFNGRLGVDLTYYNIRSSDQILNVPVAASTGYSSRILNAGELENRGVELVLNAQPISSAGDPGFNWYVNINYTRNRSEVLSLAEGIDNYQIVSDLYPADGGNDLSLEARPGEPYGQLVGLGLQRTANGDIIHVDGRPQVTSDKTSAGTYQPDYLLGVYNRFSYEQPEMGKFTFGFLIGGQVGGKIYSRNHTMLSTGGAITNEEVDGFRNLWGLMDQNGNGPGSTLTGRPETRVEYYDANGDLITDVSQHDQIEHVAYYYDEQGGVIGDGVQPTPEAQQQLDDGETTIEALIERDRNGEEVFVENDQTVNTRRYVYDYYGNGFSRDIITTGTFDATYFKLREVQLGWDVPAKWLDNSAFRGLRFSVVGRNLILWTDVPTIDPEAYSIRNGQFIPGFESTQLPSTRSFGFNINARF